MTELTPPKWRYYGGWFFFILCLLMPFTGALVPLLGLNKTTTAVLIGGLVLGGPELCMLIAIAFWGKATFNYFMEYIYKIFKRFAPPSTVSVGRYYFGLVLLFGSFIPCWIIAYVPTIVSDMSRIYIVFSFDLVFVISFFILGGDFWEKVRILFIPGPIKV